MKLRKLILPILILILAFLIYSYFSNGFIHSLLNLSPESLSSLSSGSLILAGIVFVLIMIIEVVFAPFHPLLFYLAGAIIFGPELALVLAVLGGVIGGVIAFFIARKWGRSWVEKKVPVGKREKLDKFSEKYGGWAMFLLRLNPLTSTDLWNYVAGLSKAKFWPYLIGTTLGLIPATAIMIYLGVPIQNSPILFKIFLIAIVLYLILGVALFFGLRKKKVNKTN